jgi:hypothetical protein
LSRVAIAAVLSPAAPIDRSSPSLSGVHGNSGALISSPSASWRGSDSIRVLLFSLTLRSDQAILRYCPRLLSSWPTSSTDAPRLRSIPEAVESSFPLRLQLRPFQRQSDPVGACLDGANRSIQFCRDYFGSGVRFRHSSKEVILLWRPSVAAEFNHVTTSPRLQPERESRPRGLGITPVDSMRFCQRRSFRVAFLWASEFHAQRGGKRSILRASKKGVCLWSQAPTLRRRRFDVGESFSEDD